MATAGKQMEVALRVQADLAEALQQVKAMRAELDGMRNAGSRVNTASKAVEQLATTTKATAKASQATAQAYSLV